MIFIFTDGETEFRHWQSSGAPKRFPLYMLSEYVEIIP